MNVHANARLTPLGRLLLCQRIRQLGWTVQAAAEAGNVSERTAYRWLARFDEAGVCAQDLLEAMADRSSRPESSPTKVAPKVEAAIERLRRLRWCSPAIAEKLRLPVSTVGAVLRRLGLGRLRLLDPPPAATRYQRRRPGELIHIDIKRLGRFARPGKRALGNGSDRRTRNAGWEAVHVAVDDFSRLAYVEVLPDQTAPAAVGFLRRALDWFDRQGISVSEVMTDNGSAYLSAPWAEAIADLKLRHIRTRPYRPQTNGKAERFIQILLREWAYARSYRSSDHRARALPGWVHRYNTQRPHGSLDRQAPITRIAA